jgi:hypothetical protein
MSMLTDWVAMISAGATDAAARIYPQIAPDMPTSPYIVYQRVSANSENVLSGATGLINTRLQIDVYAQTYLAALALAAQVDALMGAWAVQNVSNPSQDVFEPDVRLYRVILDYSIWHY